MGKIDTTVVFAAFAVIPVVHKQLWNSIIHHCGPSSHLRPFHFKISLYFKTGHITYIFNLNALLF